MKNILIAISLMLALGALPASSQTGLKRVYDENIDPMSQIDHALVKAAAEGKFVVCQVGGNWCQWCLRFADFAERDTAAQSERSAAIAAQRHPDETAGKPCAVWFSRICGPRAGWASHSHSGLQLSGRRQRI